jgi:hypothetical protein
VQCPARLLLAVLIVPLALVGCGSKEKTIAASKLSKLVLRQKDLLPVFSAFYLGKELGSDVTSSRRDPGRFGRRGGWTARYRRAGSPTTKGPLVIASRADLFADSGGAKKDLNLLAQSLRALPRTKALLPRLGNDAFGIEQRQGSGRLSVVSYSLVWRRANATAAIDANGFVGKFTLGDALALARKQDARMRSFVR